MFCLWLSELKKAFFLSYVWIYNRSSCICSESLSAGDYSLSKLIFFVRVGSRLPADQLMYLSVNHLKNIANCIPIQIYIIRANMYSFATCVQRCWQKYYYDIYSIIKFFIISVSEHAKTIVCSCTYIINCLNIDKIIVMTQTYFGRGRRIC